MLSAWRTLRAGLPGSFGCALGLGAGFLAFVAWDQSHWWRVKRDYGFGWLVPLFVLFVLRDRWPAIRAQVARCAAPGSPRASGVRRWLLRAVLAGSLLGGTLLFLLGSFYRAGAGTSQPGTLAITLGAVAILLPLVVINAPDSPAVAAGGFRSDARLRLAALFVFPVLIWLISAPMVSVVESQLNLALLRQVVSVVAFLFDLLGVPIEQRGNVLALPLGDVGVAEACSGIRSLTGCLFAGSFLAAVFVERAWQKLAMILAALGLAFAANLGRSLFLTAWAYREGPAAIEGRVHDYTGYAVLASTVAGLLALQRLFNPRPQ
jgi:exosortase